MFYGSSVEMKGLSLLHKTFFKWTPIRLMCTEDNVTAKDMFTAATHFHDIPNTFILIQLQCGSCQKRLELKALLKIKFLWTSFVGSCGFHQNVYTWFGFYSTQFVSIMLRFERSSRVCTSTQLLVLLQTPLTRLL